MNVYRDDMESRLKDYDARISKLHDRVNAINETVNRRPKRAFWPADWSYADVGLSLILFLLVVGGVGVLGYMAIQGMRASGRIEHCYLSTDDKQTTLVGYRSWASNSKLAFDSPYEAITAAYLMGCPLKK